MNKLQQHPDSIQVVGGVSADEIKLKLDAVREKIARGESALKAPKIISTYDSFSKVLKALTDIEEWRIYVDEYHLLLGDSAFKSLTELKLLDQLAQCPWVAYLSATPLMDEVVKEIPQLRNLPYTEYVWNPEKVELHMSYSPKPLNAAMEIIKLYQRGDAPTYKYDDGREVKSQEAIFYINSVKGIVNIIAEMKLAADDVNIIISNTESNQRLLDKLSETMKDSYCIGSFPLLGEKHKTFTFCTSTAFQGADCYSETGVQFVVSSVHQENLCIDVQYGLTQIAGRLRLDTNPFRKHIYLLYNKKKSGMTREEFDAYMSEKVGVTKAECKMYNNITIPGLRKKAIHDVTNLVAINQYAKSFTYFLATKDSFCYNKMAQLCEQHAFHVQQEVFSNGISIMREIEKTDFNAQEEGIIETDQKLSMLLGRRDFVSCCRRYALARSKPRENFEFEMQALVEEHPDIAGYYDLLGPQEMKRLGYKRTYLMEAVENRKKYGEVKKAVREAFPVNLKLETAALKEKLSLIYAETGFNYKGKPLRPTITQLKDFWGIETRRHRKEGLYEIVSH